MLPPNSPGLLYAVLLLTIPALTFSQPIPPQARDGRETIQQSDRPIRTPARGVATPVETPPDPFEGKFPASAYESEEAFFEAMHRRMEEIIRQSVDEEIARLRRETESNQARLRSVANEATEAIRAAQEGGLDSLSPEARLTRQFRVHSSRNLTTSLTDLTALLTPEEQAQLRAAITRIIEKQSPMGFYQSIRFSSDGGGEVALLTDPRITDADTWRGEFLEFLTELGLVMDEERLDALEEGASKYMESMTETRLVDRTQRRPR